MKIGGVDSCKTGWIMVSEEGDFYNFGIYNSFHDLIINNPELSRILIDIPIGLSSENFPRTIDSLIRKELGIRASTVFNAPCRRAVYEVNDEKAKKLNQKIENKSLSVQSLNIRKKIREVDEYLQNPYGNIEVIESHPELCFKYLNDNKTVISRKSTFTGIEERLELIKHFDRRLLKLYWKMLKSINRKDAKKDDLIDAICLCLVNKLGTQSGFSFITDNHIKDENQIPMKIAYYRN